MRYRQPYYDRICDILESPEASFWIKKAIHDLNQRDPLDAARDARLLAAIFEQRYTEITGDIL
ncbi:MAG: hypothetical protein KGI71_06640 [Patescibacteria group bacterium]|nr:hypothetical protein [Patescibacteria group bacterium]